MKASLLLSCMLVASLVFQGLEAAPPESEHKLFQVFQETKVRAEKGEAVAQHELGKMYFDAKGVKQDHAEAAKWFRKAAEQNYAAAQSSLGVCYLGGKGVKQDQMEAVKLFRKAAEQNHPRGQLNLGICYYGGNGVTQDSIEAMKWYRKAAEQNFADAQYALGWCFANGVKPDHMEAVTWYRKAAEQNHAAAQSNLGWCYKAGEGVKQDYTEAVMWYRKAAELNNAIAQQNLGYCYDLGEGVTKDEVQAAKWFHKAAEQGQELSQVKLALKYFSGLGVVKDKVEAYKWCLLAAEQGNQIAVKTLSVFAPSLNGPQKAEGQRLAREFQSRKSPSADSPAPRDGVEAARPKSSGTGFFITDDGHFITDRHVVGESATVRLVTATGTVPAKVVKVDKANDLVLLKAEGNFTALPVIASRGVRLGATAATVGFPSTGLQGFAPKLARGEIVSLAGAQDDSRHFQISAPIQPGNSGGALADERGNVIGMVVAKLSQKATLATAGAPVVNVNYAVKSSYLLSFLESVPEVAAKLKDAHTKDRKFEDVVKAVEQATVLVLVY